jgi:hypothetical protein
MVAGDSGIAVTDGFLFVIQTAPHTDVFDWLSLILLSTVVL